MSAIRKEVVIGDCRETYIYALCEPGGVRPHYVGKTQRRFMRRYKEHLSESLTGQRNLPVNRWVRSTYKRGSWVCYKLLETVPAGADWAARERHWIARFRQEGHQILNLTDGGEGLLGHKRPRASVEAGAAKLRRGSTFACEQCGSNFYRKRKEIEKGDCRFCSRPCYFEWQRGRPKIMPKRGAR